MSQGDILGILMQS